MKALDLFAGHGWGVACQRLGIEEMGVELMPEARATRDANGLRTIYEDVWDGLEGRATVPDYDMLIASPPCQTFSAAGGGAGRRALDEVLALIDSQAYIDPGALREFGERHDPRTALVLTPLAHVARDMPRFVVWEQVPPVLPVWERAAEEMRVLGYSVWTGVLNAEQYGVPQTRRRAVLIARADGGEAVPPTPTHSRYYPRDPTRLDPGVLPWVSMADALGWGMNERPLFTVTSGGAATGGYEPFPSHAREAIAAARERGAWVYERPATTVVGSFAPHKQAAPGYRKAGDGPRQNAPGTVTITVAEAAALQSYPPGFVFCGSKTKQFLQIGNAVPPLLAEAILRMFNDDKEVKP